MKLKAVDFATVNALPEPLRTSAPSLMKDWNTDERHGQCVEACNDFLNLLDTYGLKGDIQSWNAPGFNPKEQGLLPEKTFPWSWEGWYYHAVVEVQGLLIDWTAKQFDPNAPFPTVWRIEK